MADNTQMTDEQKIAHRAQKTYNEILEKLTEIEKSFPALSNEQIEFVRARESYLTVPQRAKFFEVLKKTVSIEDMGYDELKAKARELGIEFDKNIKKEDLRKLVQENI